MSRFVALSFPDQVKIDQAIDALSGLHSAHGTKLFGSALVTRDSEGKLSVQQSNREGLGGTAVGALIGAVAGLPAGPAAAAIMATGGAIIGNAADLAVKGDFSDFAVDVAGAVPPGGAVILADVAEDGMTAFQDMMRGIGGTVLLAK